MTNTKARLVTHPAETELADLLALRLPADRKRLVEAHIAACDECLNRLVSAHEAVEIFNKKDRSKKRRSSIMNKMNLYLILAVLSFTLSFITPRYFIQLLVATLLLGIKWIVDAKSTKMLVMIYEAWKNGGEKEASRILEAMDNKGRIEKGPSHRLGSFSEEGA